MSWIVDRIGPNGYVSERMEIGEVKVERASVDGRVFLYSMTMSREVAPKTGLILYEMLDADVDIVEQVSVFVRRFMRAYEAAKEALDAA